MNYRQKTQITLALVSTYGNESENVSIEDDKAEHYESNCCDNTSSKKLRAKENILLH